MFYRIAEPIATVCRVGCHFISVMSEFLVERLSVSYSWLNRRSLDTVGCQRRRRGRMSTLRITTSPARISISLR